MPTRRPGTVLLLALAATSLAALGVSLAVPGWVRRVGLDVWNVPAPEGDSRAARERELNAEVDEIDRVIAVKEALIADLIGGRATLAGVAADFRELDRANPAHMQVIRANFPGATDEERMARNVIRYALNRVADPGERENLRLRLEGELRALLARPAAGTEPDPARR
jgi:hypothetical protein